MAENSLSDCLGSLAALVAADDSAAIAELQRRLRDQALRLLVVGEAKRGKSSLLNALIGSDLLPTGVTPLTSLATTIRYDQVPHVDVRFVDGRSCVQQVDSLEDLVTERGNPGNRRGVAEVVLGVPAAVLAGGVELVDTPGLGSVFGQNTVEGVRARKRMDAAIVVLSGDPPISASERELVAELHAEGIQLFFVLSKVDRLTVQEADAAAEFTVEVLNEITRERPAVHRLSALHDGGRSDGPGGITEFRQVLLGFLAAQGRFALQQSLARHALRVTHDLVNRDEAWLAAARLAADDLADRVTRLQEIGDRLERQRREALDVASAEMHRVLQETDREARDVFTTHAPRLAADVALRVWATPGSAAEAEDAALAYVAEQVRQIVDSWRQSRRSEVEDRARRTMERTRMEWEAALTAAHMTVAEVLESELRPWDLPSAFSVEDAVTYAFGTEPGQIDAVTATVRRRLPGALGRRRVAEYAARRAQDLLDMHLGRARSEFQARIRDLLSRMQTDLSAGYIDGSGRVLAAATEVLDLRRRDAEACARATVLTQERAAALTRLEKTLAGLAG